MDENMNQPISPPQPLTEQENTTSIETVQWFDSIPVPPQAPKKKPVKLIVLIAGAILLIGAAIVAWAVAHSDPRCLTTDDLKTLVENSEVDAVTAPAEYFFNYRVEFQPGSTTYATEVDTTGTRIIQHISDFYKAHPNKSIMFTISSEYFNTSDKDLAQQRIGTIQSALIAAGVAATSIRSAPPVQNDPEDESERATGATIAITSAETCQ